MNHEPDSDSNKQLSAQRARPPQPQYQAHPQSAPTAVPVETSVFKHLLLMLKFQPGACSEIVADPASPVRGLVIVAIASILGFWRLCPGFGDVGAIVLSLAMMVAFPFFLVAFAGYMNLSIRLFLRDSQMDSPGFLPTLCALLFTWAPVALGTTIPVAGLVVGVLYAVALQVFAVKDLYKVPTGDAVILWAIAWPVAAFMVGLNFAVAAGVAGAYYVYTFTRRMDAGLGDISNILRMILP